MNDKSVDQPIRNAAIFAAAEIYFDFGLYCWITADCPKSGEEIDIDIIAAGNPDGEKGWGIAFETADTVSEDLTQYKWQKYAEAFEHWYLAVPENLKTSINQLLEQCNIDNCSLVTWQKEIDEMYSFRGLPGLPSGPHKKHSLYNRISTPREP